MSPHLVPALDVTPTPLETIFSLHEQEFEDLLLLGDIKTPIQAPCSHPGQWGVNAAPPKAAVPPLLEQDLKRAGSSVKQNFNLRSVFPKSDFKIPCRSGLSDSSQFIK